MGIRTSLIGYGTALAGMSWLVSQLAPAQDSIQVFGQGFNIGTGLSIEPQYILGGYVLGLGMSLYGLLNKDNIYDKFFESENMKNAKGVRPTLKKTIIKEYGYDVYFNLPSGMSLNDFTSKDTLLAFEQYLNAKVEFSYIDNSILGKVVTAKLERYYKYQYMVQDMPSKIVVGYSSTGIQVIDLADYPHMLVAGGTGTGKSVSLRSIITNLILNWKKEDLVLNLIDFKKVELGIFKGSEIVNKFITTIAETDILLDEMESEAKKRFNMFECKGLLHIQKWNSKYKKQKLNYIINIIDEFAMMEDSKETLARLKKRLAFDRAAGIYYVIATQRPSYEILPGSLKANIITKLAFQTATAVNSEIILDETGAEKLRGKGNGLLKTDKIVEIQTMFLDEDEAKKLIKHTLVNKSINTNIMEVCKVNDNGERLQGIRRNRKIQSVES